MRARLPPCRACQSRIVRSPARLTTLATSRPPQRAGIRAGMAFERDRVELGTAALSPTLRLVAEHRFARTAEIFEDGQAARPPAEFDQQPCDGARRRAVLGQQ